MLRAGLVEQVASGGEAVSTLRAMALGLQAVGLQASEEVAEANNEPRQAPSVSEGGGAAILAAPVDAAAATSVAPVARCRCVWLLRPC
ncbi:MAG: hypothetical protein JWO26_1868 [Rhodospirillales bacterium]|nr:hypothetical protein [Rhodospirillales bacterium]